MENKKEFFNKIKVQNLGRAVVNGLIESCCFINFMLDELLNVNDEGIGEYFNSYKDVLKHLYGINSYEQFTAFYKLIKPINKLNSYTIDINSLKELPMAIYMTLILKGDKSIEINTVSMYMPSNDIYDNEVASLSVLI